MELLQKSSLLVVKLYFFDLEVTISSDSHEFVDLFTKMYRRFRKNEFPSLAKSQIEFSLITHPDNPFGKPVLMCNDEIWPLNNSKLLEGFTYECVLMSIITRIKSHLLIHAGVVSFNNHGVLIVADGGHGKTTLVLTLLKRGFRFLSDEMAALGRHDHLVYPFPRSLRIRKDTLSLVGFSDKNISGDEWLDKLLLDIDKIQTGSVGTKTSIDYILFLHDQNGVTQNNEQDLTIFVDQMHDGVLRIIKNMKGVKNVRINTNSEFPVIRLCSDKANKVLSEIEAVCAEHKVLVLDVLKGTERQPLFDGNPTLHPIPVSQAAVELLGNYQGSYKSKILQEEFKGSSVRLFMELSNIIAQAKCYHLTVGPLQEMADLVCTKICS
ncbi:MAG: hypothetical protein E3K37_07835 [Candidatus Kuenenia sp.]|nr:hypothetical protein [Candidatus Kuenenia hertensis]